MLRKTADCKEEGGVCLSVNHKNVLMYQMNPSEVAGTFNRHPNIGAMADPRMGLSNTFFKHVYIEMKYNT